MKTATKKKKKKKCLNKPEDVLQSSALVLHTGVFTSFGLDKTSPQLDWLQLC